MTDLKITAEQQSFLDSIAEHVAAIHVASREFLASRKSANNAGPGRLLVTLETISRQPAANPGNQNIDGTVQVKNYCPDGTVPIFVAYDCGGDDLFACHDIFCM